MRIVLLIVSGLHRPAGRRAGLVREWGFAAAAVPKLAAGLRLVFDPLARRLRSDGGGEENAPSTMDRRSADRAEDHPAGTTQAELDDR